MESDPSLLIWRGPDFAPQRMRTQITYEAFASLNAATVLAPYQMRVFTLTNAARFDPNVTLTSSPGFNEWAGLYRKYRVRKGHVRVQFSNGEAFPVNTFVVPVNFLPSLVTVPTQYLSNIRARQKMLSAKGGLDMSSLTIQPSITDFGGSANTVVEDAYVGTVDNTTPPSDNIYILLGISTMGLASVSGVTFIIRFNVEVDFFEYQSPTA